MKNYQCKKCSMILQSDSTPKTPGCGQGPHNWVELGKVGGTNYQCKKCGLVLKSDSTPRTVGCSNQGSHNWVKL